MYKHEVTESLRSYLDRFNKVAMQIENLSDEVAIEVMKNETWLGKLKEKIMTKEPKTFSEVMSMAIKLINWMKIGGCIEMMTRLPSKKIKD